MKSNEECRGAAQQSHCVKCANGKWQHLCQHCGTRSGDKTAPLCILGIKTTGNIQARTATTVSECLKLGSEICLYISITKSYRVSAVAAAFRIFGATLKRRLSTSLLPPRNISTKKTGMFSAPSACGQLCFSSVCPDLITM